MTPLLFMRVSIFDVLAHQQQAMKKEINSLQPSMFAVTPDEELVHRLTTKYKLENPVVDEDKTYVSSREVEVDVSRDPMRMIMDRNRPFYIKGTEITFAIPFRGDPDLFNVRPSTATLNPPRGDVSGGEIHLIYTSTNNNAASVKAEYERTLKEIKQHLGWLEASVSDFNSKIGDQVRSLLNDRRRQLTAASDMVASIGFPVRQTESSQRLQSSQVRQTAIDKSLRSPKKWDVFISHASEDKDELVRPLAKSLADKGFSVWYDEFSLKIGDSLRSSIDFGLANSRYGVVVMSKSFFAKHWPIQELNGLSSKEVKGKKVILPIWHKITSDDVGGISPTLADRLAISSDVGIEKLVEEITGVLEED